MPADCLAGNICTSVMKLRSLSASLLLLFASDAFAASDLPDLGDVSQETISPRQERQLGLQIMSQIRADPSYLGDPEIAGYLNTLGNRLASRSSEVRPDQEFEFFALQEKSINAFALPGGFMGFNSGLITTAQSESELAGVMAHEMAHVTQKHLARMIAGQKYDMLFSIASLALAILAARSNPQAAQAVLTATQAGLIQSKLNFTRENEKEADRVGLQIMLSAGFDPHGMSSFFGRLQAAGRFQETGAPSYLRTHPLTYERIADIQSRTQNIGYKQVPDSLDFHLVRAKLRAAQGTIQEAINHFDSGLREKRYSNEIAERYGLISALLRDKNYERADKEMDRLYETLHPSGKPGKLENHPLGALVRVENRTASPSAMIETLAARVKIALEQPAEALAIYRNALKLYPQNRALIYDYADVLLANKRADEGLKFINKQLLYTPGDVRLYEFQAKGYEAVGNNMLQHRAQAEVYIQQGNLHAAIDQLETALRNSSDGDFYQISSIEARLNELREWEASFKKDKKK
jgi:beta-barrel assembly-enhancing protease